MYRRGLIGLAMVAAFVAIPSPAQAQFPGGGGAHGGRGGMSRGNPGDGRDAAPRAPDVVELLQIQLGELDEDLKLSPTQRKAWDLYSERVQQLAGDISRTRNALRFPKGNAGQQFDSLADTLRNRATAFEDIADAGKTLYAQLTPDQREIADRRLARVVISLVDVGQSSGGPVPGGAMGGGRTGGRGTPGGAPNTTP